MANKLIIFDQFKDILNYFNDSGDREMYLTMLADSYGSVDWQNYDASLFIIGLRNYANKPHNDQYRTNCLHMAMKIINSNDQGMNDITTTLYLKYKSEIDKFKKRPVLPKEIKEYIDKSTIKIEQVREIINNNQNQDQSLFSFKNMTILTVYNLFIIYVSKKIFN